LRRAGAEVQDRILLRPTVTLATAVAALVPLPGFHSPSGNIQCFVVNNTLHCSLARADYGAKLQARCIAPPTQLDWHGWGLGARTKGTVTCTGGILYDPETERPSRAVLQYGSSWHRGAFTCLSRTTGVTCRNRSGHGLFLSRQAWRAW
jgi:hypothetical protein